MILTFSVVVLRTLHLLIAATLPVRARSQLPTSVRGVVGDDTVMVYRFCSIEIIIPV
jgi:hypothetical protein